jgi:protein AroM
VLLCTGEFPRFESRCLIIEAQKIVDKSVEALINDRHVLGIFVPLEEQAEQMKNELSHITSSIHVVAASPYGPNDAVRKAATNLHKHQPDLVVLHCMGFSNLHRQVIREVIESPVLVAHSIVARTLAELLAR